ncbi:putative calpain-like protease palB [Rhizoctonia solani 123E]|uniref:Putative calpain-like protease palB n=1 Tax=Rhizoctonia solani 123E TaxID=1423351 RepID=A0A074RRM4_9AGAM|nr:putative calpain-like protease palB [Rhizoctonia solani 123E]
MAHLESRIPVYPSPPMSKPGSDTKLLEEAQATLTRAKQKEHAGQLDAAYHLYIECAKNFIHLATNSTHPRVRGAAKAAGSSALDRADLIKTAKKGELRRVQRDPLSEEEQLYILKHSSRVNGITLPVWPPSLSQSSRELNQPGAQFIDTDGAPQLSPAHSAASAEWKRPPAELPMVDLETPDEIVQDVVSDCSVIAALGVCAEHRQRFGSCLALCSIYPQSEQNIPFRNPQGKYCVRIMFNGTWRMIVVDELLPTSPNGRLICATTVKQAQLWPALLEKAYMKLMGGYDFPGSNSSIDLHALTSWIPEHMYLNGNDFQREKSWKRIYDGFVNGKVLLTLGTGETVTGEGRWKDILIAAHNYAIVGLEDDGTTQNLKVLNPWRRTDASEGGGLLTISWGLVCNLFESVYLNWDPNLFPHSKVIHGIWREPTDASGEHSASNHHYRLRYTNPEVVTDSPSPEIWVLLTRHVLSKETKADYIALHHFSHTEAGRLPRADQVPNKGTYSDSPHILTRIKHVPSEEVISLIAAREGSGPETGYTFSIYSHASIEIEAVSKVLGYIKTTKGAFTSKSAGGNASLPTFMNNPQYSVRIGGTTKSSRGQVPLKLTIEGARTLPLNIKLVWSGGKRVSDVVAGDIVLDSGAYNFGLACTEGEVQPGDYTLVVSSFRAGQQGEYVFRVECDANAEITQLPAEGAGMFHKTIRGTWDTASAAGGPSSGQYESNPTFEVAVSGPTQISARLQMASKQQSYPPPALNLTLFERNAQGLPGRQVATSGAYSDAVSGVMLPSISLRPGIYLFVPSTYYPGVLGDFQILLYSTTNTLNPIRIR